MVPAVHTLTFEDFQHCFDETPSRTYLYVYTILFAIVPIIIIYCTLPYLKPGNIKVVGQIEFDFRNPISPNIIRGRIIRDSRHAAIKRLPKLSKESCNELRILLRMANKGPANNVIQYLWFEEEYMFTYIALELCEGDLAKAVTDRVKEVTPYLTPQHCLLQITQGLSYVPQQKIPHRDIKPQNILWKYSGVSRQVRFVISDFDLGLCSNESSSHKSMYGTLGWTAPELWSSTEGERTFAVDIFSLGCVFYYVLTMAGHPFGSITDPSTCQHNISEGSLSESFEIGMDECCSAFVMSLATDVIRKMIQCKGSDRPEACAILKHPLLETVVTFFHDMGNYMEDSSPNLTHLKVMLEKNAATVFEGSWMEKLEKPVRKDVQGFKKQCREICGLLRVVRNKIEHVRYLGEEVKRTYRGSPEGVVQYYNKHFPRLLLYAYCTEQEWAKTAQN